MLRLTLVLIALLTSAPGVVQAAGATVDLPATDPQTQVCHKGLKDTLCSFLASVPLLGGTIASFAHAAATFACAVMAPLKEVHYEVCA